MGKSLEERIRILEDREEIIKLKARYTNVNDGGWNGIPTHHDVEGLVNMFVPDGIWDGSPYLPRVEGHAQIRELFTSFGAQPFVMHNVMNPIIEIDGDTAHGDWHAIIPGIVPPNIPDMPPNQAVWVLGKYQEDYVRTPEGWKFKLVRFISAAITPYESGWGKTQYATGA